MTPPSTNLSFSTEDLPPRDRLPIWREVFARNVLQLGWDPIAEGAFRCEAKLSALPGLRISSISASAGRNHRSREMVGDGNGDYSFGISISGNRVVSQCGRELTVEAGDAYLLKGTEPASVRFSSGSRYVLAVLPSLALHSMVHERNLAAPLTIPRGSPTLKLLIGYLDLLQQGHTLAAPHLQRHAVSHVYDLVGLAIGATRDAAHVANGRGVRAARLEAVRADILANLSRVSLSPKTVARRLGVSERYVHLLFEGTGETFGQVVTKARLNRAFDLLCDPNLVGKISDIAQSVGYGDLSTFNRAIRRHFGDTPSGLRNSSPRRGFQN